jgi:hypothetical protein
MGRKVVGLLSFSSFILFSYYELYRVQQSNMMAFRMLLTGNWVE